MRRSTSPSLLRYQSQAGMRETKDAEPHPPGGAAMNAAAAFEPVAEAPTGEAPRPVAATIEAFLASVERRAWRIAEIALHDPDEALDAVQDAMLRLVRHYSAKPAEEWPPLFWGILRRRITDLQRRRTVRNRILVWTRRAPGDEEDLPAWEAPDLGPEPARALASRQAHAAMSKAIRALPRRQQQAFMLRILEGLGVADTAKAMGCSEGSVKTHLSRAMDALRTQLEDWR
jgi:RNA polymerase sigma factor (sigma-70 family)